MVYTVDHTYPLRHTFATRMMMFMPVLLLGAGLVVGLVLLAVHGPVLPEVVIFPVWFLVIAIVSGQYLRLPHTIEWSSQGTITFRSYLKSIAMSPRDIVSIQPNQSTIGILKVLYGEKKLNVLSQFDGFHDFLQRLKAENPSVELRGC